MCGAAHTQTDTNSLSLTHSLTRLSPQRELRRAAPHASVVGVEGSGDGHLLLTSGDVADIAADSAFQAPALRRARALSLPVRIPLPAEGYGAFVGVVGKGMLAIFFLDLFRPDPLRGAAGAQ